MVPSVEHYVIPIKGQAKDIMKKDNKTGSDKIKEMVSEKLIEGLQKAIDNGIGSWQMPWSGGNSFPKNFKSGKGYRGINILTLGLQGYESPTWLTFKQAFEEALRQAKADGREIEERVEKNRRGIPQVKYYENGELFRGGVKKGEKSTPVIYWSWLYKDEAGKTVKDRKLAVKKIPMLRYFQVFNIAQCDGIKDKWQPTPDKEHNPIKEAELMVENMPNAPEITFKEAKAYYRPATDSVNMPRLGLFRSAEEYYSTLFHELIHSTGHKSRLDREGITEFAGFGSETYSKEELVAEMGAAMLCAITGVKNEAMEKNQVSYLRGWIKALKDDINLAVSAGGQAQRAVDYIEGTTWED
jgi:antirestriction protein ArdC